MPSRATSRLRRYWPALLILALGLAVSGGLGWELHRQAVNLDKQRLTIRIKTTVDELDGGIEKTELMLRQLQDYLQASPDITPAAFRDWISKHRIPINFRWLHGIGFVTNLNAGAWRTAFPAPPETWSKDDFKRFHRWATVQSLNCKLADIYMAQKNRQWLEGYAIEDQYEPRTGFSTVARTDSVKMSFRHSAMRETNGNLIYGCYFYLPIYDAVLPKLLALSFANRALNQEAIRWTLCRGFVIAPVDFGVLESRMWVKNQRDLGVEIFSAKQPSMESWLNPGTNPPRALAADSKSHLTRTHPWPMYGKGFSLFFYTMPLFDAQSPRRMARIAFGAGAAITLLASALVGVSLRAGTRQERMTSEVIEARDALAAAKKEREKLGHDLHDGAIQSLYAIQLGLSRTAQKVEAVVPSSARALNETRERLDEVIAELRRFILAREADEATAPVPGLDRVLTAMIERLQPTSSAKLSFQSEPGAAARVSPAQAVQLTQIVRSAVANSLRHARARHVDVRLSAHDSSVRLEIVDDGIGFDTTRPCGLGLQSMSKRAAEAGGALTIESVREQSTRIIAVVPALAENDGI